MRIPYGYRIEKGLAVPDLEKTEKLNKFIDAFLSGMSVEKAKELTGIEMSRSGLMTYLRRGLFFGTDYYPPIVEKEKKERLHAELEKRTHPGTLVVSPPVPVQTLFRMRETPAVDQVMTAVELYNCIEADPVGNQVMTAAEEKQIRQEEKQIRQGTGQ